MLYLRTQKDVLASIQRRLRDSGQSRWSNSELADALNRALETWHGRVSVQAVYELANGWPNDAFEVTLADWLPDQVRPQAKWPVDPLLPNEATLSTWKDVTTWQVEPAEDGTRTLRLNVVPYNGQLRLLYPVWNGMAPMVDVAISAGMTSTDSSVTLDAALPEIARVGWVQVDAEWMQYAGVTVGASTTTLANLVRGVNDTTAATHDSATAVQWGVAAPNIAAYTQLADQACAFVHELCLTDGSPKERDLHERMLSYFQQRADLYWRRNTPNRAPKWKYYA